MTRDFLCRILCSLIGIPQGIFVLVYLRIMLTPSEDTPRRRTLIWLWVIVNVFFSFFHYFIRNPMLTIVQNIVTLLLVGCIAITCYTERPLKKLLATFLLMFAPVLADAITSAVYSLLLGASPVVGLLGEMDFNWVILCAATFVNGAALQGAICMIWCRVIKRNHVLKYAVYMLAFLILCVGVLAINIWGAPASKIIPESIYLTIYMCAFLTILGSVLVLANQAEKNAIAKELEEIHQFSQLEHIHYTAIEARREEMARIRHDYTNVLTSATHLLRSGACQEAAGLLSDLSQRISDTQETVFCSIPVINAVILEKQRQCQHLGITLQTQLELPDQMPIPELHLFSAFNGLLDQAISLCDPKAPEGITLSCRVIQEYLVIKCVTPVRAMPTGSVKNSEFLKETASQYRGDFSFQQTDSRLTAQLSLGLAALPNEKQPQHS